MATFTAVERDAREILAATVRASGLVALPATADDDAKAPAGSRCSPGGPTRPASPPASPRWPARSVWSASTSTTGCARTRVRTRRSPELCAGARDRARRRAAATRARQRAGGGARGALRGRPGADAVRGAAWIATGHTRTDLAETFIYRLATSPGRRALLGMPARRGAVIRPLLALGRDDARRLATEAGLPFRDDPSNLDPRFARARIRHEVLPVLRELNPAAEDSIAATRAELAEEGEAARGARSRGPRGGGHRHRRHRDPGRCARRASPGGAPARAAHLRRACRGRAVAYAATPPRGSAAGRLPGGRRGRSRRRSAGGLRGRRDQVRGPAPEPGRQCFPFPAAAASAAGRCGEAGGGEGDAGLGPEVATLDAAALGPC